jgi:hypothetical protein
MVSLGINTCFIPLSCQLRGLFASKHSLMTVLSDGGESVASDRRLLPDASSFTGFGVSVSDHSLPGILRIWPGFLWSVFTASVGHRMNHSRFQKAVVRWRNKLPLVCKLHYAKLFSKEFLLCYVDMATPNSVTDHCNTVYFFRTWFVAKIQCLFFSLGRFALQ